jgi:hypothetical protein
VIGFFGVEGQGQGVWIGQANVLGSEPHQTPDDIHRVLATVEHPGQPVQSGVGVSPTDSLVQSGYEVVVFLGGLVIDSGAFLMDLF